MGLIKYHFILHLLSSKTKSGHVDPYLGRLWAEPSCLSTELLLHLLHLTHVVHAARGLDEQRGVGVVAAAPGLVAEAAAAAAHAAIVGEGAGGLAVEGVVAPRRQRQLLLAGRRARAGRCGWG